MPSNLLSVLMPVYNAEKYLEEAIQSILNQTFRDYEFIIINDGSTDNSEAIIQKFAQQDPRIKLTSRPNTGYTIALNEGLSKAQGKYVARMDSDDVSLPDRFASQIDFLESHPEHVAVGSRVMLIDPEGWPISSFSQFTDHDDIDNAHMGKEGGAICHPAVMIRRDALDKIDGYRVELEPSEDIDLFLRLAEVGKLANLSETLLNYRMHAKSVGHTRRELQDKHCNIAVEEAHLRRGLTPPTASASVTELKKQSPISELHGKWAWWALSAGNAMTARKHAVLALSKNPVVLDSWKVFACSLRGY